MTVLLRYIYHVHGVTLSPFDTMNRAAAAAAAALLPPMIISLCTAVLAWKEADSAVASCSPHNGGAQTKRQPSQGIQTDLEL